MDIQEKNNLTSGCVWKKLLIFFLPIAAGTCIQQLYNAVDALVVGRFVGTTALAAVGGSSAMIINVLVGFFVSLTTGAAVVIAQIYGAGRSEDVQHATGTALIVCSVLGLVLMAFGLLLTPWMLRLLKTPADTISQSALYLRVYFLGVPFILVLNMESNMLRAVGDSFHPFVYMVIACLTNIVLDFALVVFFHWGVFGVAIATVLAQVLNMALLTRLLLTTKQEYRLTMGSFRFNRNYIASMARLGIPSGLQSSMYSLSNLAVQIGINTLGTVVVASWAMSSKVDGVYWAISNAIGAAVTTFIAQNIGAKKYDRVKLCVRQGFLVAMIMTVFLSTVIMILARPLLGILTEDTAVIDTTYEILTFFVPYYFTWTVVEILSGVLRGAGDAISPVVMIGLGVCLLRIVWIFTVFQRWHTLPVLSYCYVVSWAVTGIIMFIHYRKGKWLNAAEHGLKERSL